MEDFNVGDRVEINLSALSSPIFGIVIHNSLHPYLKERIGVQLNSIPTNNIRILHSNMQSCWMGNDQTKWSIHKDLLKLVKTEIMTPKFKIGDRVELNIKDMWKQCPNVYFYTQDHVYGTVVYMTNHTNPKPVVKFDNVMKDINFMHINDHPRTGIFTLNTVCASDEWVIEKENHLILVSEGTIDDTHWIWEEACNNNNELLLLV